MNASVSQDYIHFALSVFSHLHVRGNTHIFFRSPHGFQNKLYPCHLQNTQKAHSNLTNKFMNVLTVLFSYAQSQIKIHLQILTTGIKYYLITLT